MGKASMVRLCALCWVACLTGMHDAQGQDQKPYQSHYGPRLAYSYNRFHEVRAGIGGTRQRELSLLGAYRSHSYFFDLGYATDSDQSVMTSRVSYDYVEVLLAARLSLVNYTNFRQQHTFILPEAGITFRGVVSILYGYRLDVTPNEFGVSRNSVSVTVNLF